MIKFSKVLAINCLICLVLSLTVWIVSGVGIETICTYNSTAEEYLCKLSPGHKHFLDNGDWIALATDQIKIPLIMTFPYALVITLSSEGRIAYSQTLAKSQRGRDFVERLKSLDISFGKALRKLVGNQQQ